MGPKDRGPTATARSIPALTNETLMHRIQNVAARPRPAAAPAPAPIAPPAPAAVPAAMTVEQQQAAARLAARQAQLAGAPAPAPAMAPPPPPLPRPAPPMASPPLAPQPAAAPVPAEPFVAAPAPAAMPSSTPAMVPAGPAPLLSFRPQEADVQVAEVPRGMRMNREDRPEAWVIDCDGNMAVVQGDTKCVDSTTGLTWAVGRMLSIVVGDNRVVGMVCNVRIADEAYSPEGRQVLHFQVELQGEVQDKGNGELAFQKGISSYPGVGSLVHQIRAGDLHAIYAARGDVNAVIGNLSQDATIPAFLNIPDMLSKHFAVLGSTGCGKSASVSLLLHACQEMVPDLRTIILDPHNEYSRAFPEANTIAQADLDLPFWMLALEEYVECLFRGKPIVHEEVDALREFIPDAKAKFRDGEDRVRLSRDNGPPLTADTPVPYRIADLLAAIDEEMGLLESRYDTTTLKSLKARIDAHCNDRRFAFMFRHRTIEDIAAQVISRFFCLPGNGRSLTTIIQMAGMPSEVVNALATVLCRLSFELAIAGKGNLKVLVVCEEAHRYVPAGKDGFEPTRRAIARIAKEGRKYGSFMAIISQRPSELDPTILSQCSTVFSLRLTNDHDQEIIKRSISSSSSSAVSFISSLANRECIAFGEGLSTPMRMKFRMLPKEWLPGADADVFGNNSPVTTPAAAQQVFSAWRV